MINLIESLLPAGMQVFETDASTADLDRLPYVLVLGRPGVRDREETMSGRDSASSELTVRAVGASTRQVLATLARIRPGLDRETFQDGFFTYTLVVDEERGPTVDRDVIIPKTGAHPVFADDVYAVYTQ